MKKALDKRGLGLYFSLFAVAMLLLLSVGSASALLPKKVVNKPAPEAVNPTTPELGFQGVPKYSTTPAPKKLSFGIASMKAAKDKQKEEAKNK